ncbi:MAG: hypothetical protein ACFCUS_07295, partial [Rubrimonas sp.]
MDSGAAPSHAPGGPVFAAGRDDQMHGRRNGDSPSKTETEHEHEHGDESHQRGGCAWHMLAARWTWRESSIAIAPRVHAHLLTLATAANRLRDEAAAQRTARRLTEAGMRAHLVEFLARTFGPAYRRADDEGRRGLIRAIETVRAQGVRKIDPADGAAAIMAAPPRDLATALLEIPLSFAGL